MMFFTWKIDETNVCLLQQIVHDFQSYLVAEELDNILNDDEQFYTLLAEVVNDSGVPVKVLKIKCAAHTLQLIVRGGLKNSTAKNLIKVCRIAIKLLRKPNILNEAREKGLMNIVPRYDCLTRWSSTFIMVNLIQIGSILCFNCRRELAFIFTVCLFFSGLRPH
jgi:hypothetical protein